MQYKNTNSGRRNLLNVKNHIKKIGFELVLENSTVWYGAQFCRKTVPCNWPSKRESTFSELGLQMRYGVAGGVWGGTQVRACYSCRRELQCIREITWSLPNVDVMHHNTKFVCAVELTSGGLIPPTGGLTPSPPRQIERWPQCQFYYRAACNADAV